MLKVRWFFRTLGLAFLTLACPFAALFFLAPADVVDGRAFDNPPIGAFVTITFDRVEQLPWTIVSDGGDTVVHHLALGILGKRALIVETGKDELAVTNVTGEVHQLSGAVAKWANEDPYVNARSYDAVLEIKSRDDRMIMGVGAALVWLAALAAWIRRFIRWRKRHATA